MPRHVLVHLLPLILREWQHHPWRHGVALLAVALGVALAFSVQLINDSALTEFSSAVRAANGEPDLSLRGGREGFDDALIDAVEAQAGVIGASPVLEIDTYAHAADRKRVAVRVLGVDALKIAAMAAELMPMPAAGAARTAVLDPDAVFANATARDRLGLNPGDAVQLQSGPAWRQLRLAGHIAAGGPPLLVMDIAGAQSHFGLPGRLSRIDLRLRPGQSADALLAALQLPADVAPVQPGADEQRLSALSRAYRVNLIVLALVALFVGGFLVFSVISLSVAQRTPTFALLGVLGLTANERRALVLAECALLGAAGSIAGLALGTAMASAALRWLGGDLGGGFFPGVLPALQFKPWVAAGFALLGTATSMFGGWWPAHAAAQLAPAQALKGLGSPGGKAAPWWPGAVLLAAGVVLSFLPPVVGVPLAAYLAVASLLFGGTALVPVVVQALLSRPPGETHPLALLAHHRARFQRATASAAVAGVVSSLALSVALTVMVGSFRASVSHWLDGVLPADLYARSAATSAGAEQAWFGPEVATRAAALPGVARLHGTRVRALQLAPGRPPVALLARPLPEPERNLPLVQAALPARAGEVGVFVSEAMVSLYGATPGQIVSLPVEGKRLQLRVLGVWRDFARQFGSIVIDHASYVRLTGDARLNELAVWLSPGADVAAVQAGIRALLPDPTMLDFAATTELRAISLRIFDRSFAVTYYLQAVAITIGLVGIAASVSAQVLARRKEFGLLSHLGLTRRQVLAVVAAEGAAWMAAGTLIGLLLGLAVSAVLVFVVNPQSFHWSMDLAVPWARLAALCLAVMAAGVATSLMSARQAASRSAVLSVKEDW